MAKLLILVTLTILVVMAESQRLGKVDFRKFINRRDPFPEPQNPPPSTSNIEERFITQRLDNFDPVNDDTWEQRYLMTAEHFETGGCIFLFLSGEWSVTEYRLENSLMAEMAADLNCYIFYLEHRYFGESRPTPNVTDENLRFLTVDQALADTAHFVDFVKGEFPGAEDAPVIVIGGHYSASLAMWFRQSYPALADFTWASSAPTLAIADHFQYKELSGAVYRQVGGNECYNVIERGFAEMEEMVQYDRLVYLSDMFNLCDDIEGTLDVQMFFSTLSEFFSLLAQFDVYANVEGVCDLMLSDEHETPAEAVAAVVLFLAGDECIPVDYDEIIEADRQTGWDDPAVVGGFRQYTYMACTQFGWYHSSRSRFQPYGSSFPVEFIFQACEDVFGDAYDSVTMLQNVQRFNNMRGGLTPAATNVLYVHGQFDPWRSIGVQTSNHPTVSAIVIPRGSQGTDLGPSTDLDSDAVAAAKVQIREIITEFVSDFRA
ncbi:hypothetical protein HA402_007487 [Bradysia odoriphaga]|nr:hypothetical protein HA402_007487 [Bradysia odoriphaga]